MNGHGGARPNSGRKPREKVLTNYQKAIKLLDNSIEQAIETLIECLSDDSVQVRLKAAEILLKKTLPDRKEVDLNDKTDRTEIQKELEEIRNKIESSN
jgi:MFS superfamily sulfate permease-like transporter